MHTMLQHKSPGGPSMQPRVWDCCIEVGRASPSHAMPNCQKCKEQSLYWKSLSWNEWYGNNETCLAMQREPSWLTSTGHHSMPWTCMCRTSSKESKLFSIIKRLLLSFYLKFVCAQNKCLKRRAETQFKKPFKSINRIYFNRWIYWLIYICINRLEVKFIFCLLSDEALMLCYWHHSEGGSFSSAADLVQKLVGSLFFQAVGVPSFQVGDSTHMK